MMMHPTIELATQKLYNEVPAYVKEDITYAAEWARTTLTELEGKGHHIEVVGEKNGLVVCAFAKPEWSGDHCGRGMETGSEAIVMAVCEYMAYENLR